MNKRKKQSIKGFIVIILALIGMFAAMIFGKCQLGPMVFTTAGYQPTLICPGN